MSASAAEISVDSRRIELQGFRVVGHHTSEIALGLLLNTAPDDPLGGAARLAGGFGAISRQFETVG